MKPEHTIKDLSDLLNALDGQPFGGYQTLLSKRFCHKNYQIRFLHIQGSPGAFPASTCRLSMGKTDLGIPEACLTNPFRTMAAADYLVRAFGKGVAAHARQNRGAQGSGSFQPVSLPPQVLERNLVRFNKTHVQILFHLSLPGSHENRILGRQAAAMFEKELTGILRSLREAVARTGRLKHQCEVVEDMLSLQNRLSSYGLMAFVGDGALLPRSSGISQAPLKERAIAFHAPDKLAVEVRLPNAGRIRGMGVRPGINLIIGSGFHGKSTLLNALASAIYPHIPGDGRERVVTHPEAVFICAEQGRAVTGLDISGFINHLPGGMDPTLFSTKNASGSTSEAAAIIEAVLAGAKFLLMDEDSSSTNFLIKDQNLRRLIPEDTITPLFDRVEELYKEFGVSTLMVVGGSSEYLGVSTRVIAMHNYLPEDMTDQARQLSLPAPKKPDRPLIIADRRRVLKDNFNPAYVAARLKKTIPVRIKPLRHQEKVLEYGNERLDLTRLAALVDPLQVTALGFALLLARDRVQNKLLSPSELAAALHRLIETQGLDILSPPETAPLFFACLRRLELSGAINRLRSLKVSLSENRPEAS